MSKLAVITDTLSADPGEAMRMAKAAGIDHVELQSVWNKTLSDLDRDELRTLKALAQSEGVSVCCLSQKNLFGGMPVGSTEPESDIFKEHLQALEKIADMADLFGTSVVRIMCFRKEMVLFGSEGAENAVVTRGAWDRFVDLMGPAVRYAEQRGLTLAVENSTKGMVTSAFLARKLIDAIGSPSLKALWDPCNALYYNERPFPEGFAQLKGGYLAHVHIKDGIANVPEASMHFRPLGDGHVGPHLDDISAGLKAEGYEGFVSMESLYRPSPGDAAGGFAASVGRAVALFGK